LRPLKSVPNFENVGVVSPRVPLPAKWPGVKKDTKATHLCWAYPIAGVSPRTLGGDASKAFLSISTSAELRFAAYGGFLLLDGKGKVVQAQAVGDDRDQATSLCFSEAKTWTRPEILGEMEEAGRLQLVTLPALRARGADKFCWIGAGETFGSGAQQWTPTSSGGFLYLMSGGKEPIYFVRQTS
jgi:hypothetical protein